MSVTLKDGTTVQDPRLGRLKQFDERSRNFPIMALVEEKKPRSYSWSCGLNLDQGYDSSCTGFSVTHEAVARPVVVKNLTNEIATEIYHRARQLDEWPGEDYDGSSVLAAIKAGKERNWYLEYRWAFGLQDLIYAVGLKGPAVLGINWYEGMFNPDENGFIKPTGDIAGGHAILCNKVSLKGKYFTLHNSWGVGWGVSGEAKISFEDTEKLLYEYGEACIPVKRALGNKVV